MGGGGVEWGSTEGWPSVESLLGQMFLEEPHAIRLQCREIPAPHPEENISRPIK